MIVISHLLHEKKFKTENKVQEINPDRDIYHVGTKIDGTQLMHDLCKRRSPQTVEFAGFIMHLEYTDLSL